MSSAQFEQVPEFTRAVSGRDAEALARVGRPVGSSLRTPPLADSRNGQLSVAVIE